MAQGKDSHADTATTPPRPIPAAAVAGDLPPARPESQGSFDEQGVACLTDGTGERWLVRVAGRSLTGRGTSTPIQLALLVFSAIDPEGDTSRGDLEALVPASSVESRWGFDTEGLFAALSRAEPGQGASPQAKGFFAELVPSPRARGGGETSGRTSRS